MSQQYTGGPPFRPRWTQELFNLHFGRVSRQFVLHFNITDYIVDLDNQQPALELGTREFIPCGNVFGTPKSFREYLHDFLRNSRLHCQAIYTYSLAGGLDADEPTASSAPLDTEMHRTVWQRVHDAWAGIKPPQRK